MRDEDNPFVTQVSGQQLVAPDRRVAVATAPGPGIEAFHIESSRIVNPATGDLAPVASQNYSRRNCHGKKTENFFIY
jgi:hypothetical protein